MTWTAEDSRLLENVARDAERRMDAASAQHIWQAVAEIGRLQKNFDRIPTESRGLAAQLARERKVRKGLENALDGLVLAVAEDDLMPESCSFMRDSRAALAAAKEIDSQ